MQTIRTILWALRHPIYAWRGIKTAEYYLGPQYEADVKRFCTELATYAADVGKQLSEYADALDRQQSQVPRDRKEIN